MWALSEKEPIKTTKDKPFKENLLCRKCDNDILGQFDKYFSDFLYNETNLKIEKKGDLIYLENVSAEKLKGFVLGTLFRMHLTSKPVFKEVDLGEKHSEIIRNRLLNSAIFDDEEYPITLTFPMYQGKFHDNMFLQPDRLRDFGNMIYRFIISGVFFTVLVGNKRLPKELYHLSVKNSGKAIILLKEINKIEFLEKTLNRLKA